MKAALASILFCASLAPGAIAQQQQQQQANPQKKPAKVYTNDDLEGLSGGISTVGEASKPEKPDTGTAEGETKSPAPTAPKSKKPPQKDQCADWGWGEVVAATLGSQGVPFDAAYWVDKTWGTGRCLSSLPSASGLASSIDGDYALDDGSKIRVQSIVGAPSGAGVVESIQKNRPFIVLWRGIPYLASGVRGVKMDNGDGSYTYYIREMTLNNPYLGKSVTFNSEKDKESELEAVIFKVTNRQ